MSAILAQWGTWSISVYAACLSLGLILALLVAGLEARLRHIRAAVWLDAALAALTIGVVAARLGYAALNWTYFQQHPLEILEVWEGGLSWHTGLIGGALGAWLIAHRSADHRPIELLDVFALALPVGLVFGWLGSYFTAAAYGRELYPSEPFFWLAVDRPDLYGVVNPRWPSQLLGAGWSGLIAIGLWAARRRVWPPGTRFWLCLAAYSLGSGVIGLTRADDVPLLAGWRVDQVLDAMIVVVSLSQLLRGSLAARRKDAHGRSPGK
ncbi:MAG: prolipoprotein diacylglyceryl transferase [Thermoflexales bacterium]|nr:prolipoprotein diacylglyceryl transferase [Thermoflexales bacterium]